MVSSAANISFSKRIVLIFILLLWLCGIGALISYFWSQRAASHDRHLQHMDVSVSAFQKRVETIIEQGIQHYLENIARSSRETIETLNNEALIGILTEKEAKKIAGKLLVERYGTETERICVFNSQGNLQVHADTGLIGLNLMVEKNVQRQIEKKTCSFIANKSRGEQGLRPLAVSSVYYEPWDWIISASYYLDEFSKISEVRDVLAMILAEEDEEAGQLFLLSAGNADSDVEKLNKSGYTEELSNIKGSVIEQKNGLFQYTFRDNSRVVRFVTVERFGLVVGMVSDYSAGKLIITDHLNVFVWPVLLCLLTASLITIRLGRSIRQPITGLVKNLQRTAPESIAAGPVSAENEYGLLVEAFQKLQAQNEQTKNKLVAEIRARQNAENELHEEITTNREVQANLREEIESRKEALDKLGQEINTRKSAEVYLQLFKNIFDHAVEGILITDRDAKILAVNKSFTKLTGYPGAEVLGQNPRILQSGRHTYEFFERMWRDLREKGGWTGEIWNKKKNGVVYPELLSISAIRDERGVPTHYFAFMHDMTEMKKKEELISFMAYHDVLTKLPNRVSLETRLSKALSFARRNSSLLAVFFIDLDNFKNINDSLGHDKGDQLLVSVSQRISVEIRDEDTLSRLGGDEFIILAENIRDVTEISALAQRILESFKKPFEIESRPIYISASIGISVFPHDGSTIQELIKNADIAMYQAKGEGRNKYMMFTQEMNERLRMHVRVENAIRASLKTRDFVVHYQPKVRLDSGMPSSFEALIRWENQEKRIGPDQFIPVAEKSHLIDDLTLYMLEEVCVFLNHLKEKGLQVPVSINISPRTFTNEDVVDTLNQILARFNVDHRLIEFEITETTAMTDVEHTLEIMHQFRNRGYHFSIDDFGTGYSSLAYLNLMPLSTLKIDKQFIAEVESRGIASTIVAIAKEMKLKVVAEGVETDEQLEWLRELGCDEIQGYYFSKPLPANEAELYLMQQQAKV